MWQPGWEASLGKNGYMYMYGQVPLLFTWNYHDSSTSMPSELPGKPHWRQKEKREAEEEMVGGHHQCNGINLGKLWEMVGDREAWHAAVHAIMESQARLGYWTTTKPQYKIKSIFKKESGLVSANTNVQLYSCDSSYGELSHLGCQNLTFAWWSLMSIFFPLSSTWYTRGLLLVKYES